MTEGLSLGTPEYAALITLFGVWFVGMNWMWLKRITPSAREAKRYEGLSRQLTELAETIKLTFESVRLIYANLPVTEKRLTLRVLNEPAAEPLIRRLRFCQVELSSLGIDSSSCQ